MKKIIVSGLLLSLVGCGGGGSGSEKANTPEVSTPQPTPSVTNSILGIWNSSSENCRSAFVFNEDNEFRVHSASFMGEGTFEFINTVDEGKRHKLTLNFKNQNLEPDCYGDYEDISGLTGELYVSFSEEKVTMWDLPENGEVVFTIRDENELTFTDTQTEIAFGETFIFEVDREYESSAKVFMTSAPEGAEFDGSRVSWLATPQSLANKSQHTFTFESADAALRYSKEVKVLASKQQLKSVSYLPVIQSEIVQAHDLFGDAKSELISINEQSLSILTLSEGKLSSKISYPYPVTNKFLVNETKQMFFVDEQGVKLVTDLTLPPSKLIELDNINAFGLGDVTGNSEKELVFITADGSDQTIHYFSQSGALIEKRLLPTNLPSILNSKPLIFTNIDEDPQLEIISNSFEEMLAIDEKSLQIEQLGYSLSDVHQIVDINNDGVSEFISGNEVWSAIGGSEAVLRVNAFNLAGDQKKLQFVQSDGDKALMALTTETGSVGLYNYQNGELKEISTVSKGATDNTLSVLAIGNFTSNETKQLLRIGLMESFELVDLHKEFTITPIEKMFTGSTSSIGFRISALNQSQALFISKGKPYSVSENKNLLTVRNVVNEDEKTITLAEGYIFWFALIDTKSDGVFNLAYVSEQFGRNTLHVLDLETYQPLHTIDLNILAQGIESFDLNQDGFEEIIYTDSDNFINVIDFSSGILQLVTPSIQEKGQRGYFNLGQQGYLYEKAGANLINTYAYKGSNLISVESGIEHPASCDTSIGFIDFSGESVVCIMRTAKVLEDGSYISFRLLDASLNVKGSSVLEVEGDVSEWHYLGVNKSNKTVYMQHKESVYEISPITGKIVTTMFVGDNNLSNFKTTFSEKQRKIAFSNGKAGYLLH